jgi:hypothetical protein
MPRKDSYFRNISQINRKPSSRRIPIVGWSRSAAMKEDDDHEEKEMQMHTKSRTGNGAALSS